MIQGKACNRSLENAPYGNAFVDGNSFEDVRIKIGDGTDGMKGNFIIAVICADMMIEKLFEATINKLDEKRV